MKTLAIHYEASGLETLISELPLVPRLTQMERHKETEPDALGQLTMLTLSWVFFILLSPLEAFVCLFVCLFV